MARPRKTETRRSVTIRLGPAILALLDKHAQGRTRTSVIEEAIVVLDSYPSATTPPAAIQTALKATLDTERAQCQHTWKKLSYGNFCEHCGANKDRQTA